MAITTDKRTLALLRIQRELAEAAITTQVLSCRMAHMGRKGYAERLGKSATAMATVVMGIGNAAAIPFFHDHFPELHHGNIVDVIAAM